MGGGGGGHVKFYPYKVLVRLKGGYKKFEVVLTRELEVLVILKGEGGAGAKRFKKGMDRFAAT